MQTLDDDWGGINNTDETIEKYGVEVPPGQEWGMNRGEVERFEKKILQEHEAAIEDNATDIETLGGVAIGDVVEGAVNPATRKKPIHFYKANDPEHEHPVTIEVAANVGGEEQRPKITVSLNTANTIKKGDTIDFDWVYDFIHIDEEGNVVTGGIRPTPQNVTIEVKAGNTLIYSDTVNGGVVEHQPYNVRFANPNVTGMVTITVVATVVIDNELAEARGGEVVTIVEMRLSTDFSPARLLSNGGIEPKEVSVGCSYRVPQGSTLYVWLDGVLFDNPSIGTNSTYWFGDSNINGGNGLAAGRHNLQFVAQNGLLLSNVVIVDFLVRSSDADYLGIRYSCDVESIDSLPFSHAYGEASYPAKVERFSNLLVEYAVWNATSNESEVKVYITEQEEGSEPVSTLTQDLSIDRTLTTLRQRFNKTTEKGATIEMGTASIGFNVNVVSTGELDITVEPNVYKELLAEGKSNSQNDRDDWGGITTFEGVNWNTNGWHTDDDGITSLLLTNGAKATIDLRPFAEGSYSPQDVGMALQLKFKVSHVTERGTTVIRCLSENEGNEGWPTGFMVTSEKAGLLLGGKEDITTTEKKTYNGIHNGVPMDTYIDDNGHTVEIGDWLDDNDNWVETESQAAVLKIEKAFGVEMDIATDKWIDMMLVVYTPAQVAAMYSGQATIGEPGEYGLSMLYLNGVLSRVNRFNYQHEITQDSPAPIVIDSDKANVYVRLLRWYTRPLKADAAVNNWILGLDTQADMVTAYNRNEVGDGNTQDSDGNATIGYEKLGTKRKGRLTIIKSSADYSGGATGVEELFADGVGKKTNFHADLVRWEPPQDENGTSIGEGFEARNVRIRIQGTSSVNYPYKNIRVYLTTPFNKSVGCSLKIGDVEYTYDSASGKLKDGEGHTCQGYCMRGNGNSRPQTVFCAKTDFVDSSLTLNTGGAHLFNDVMDRLGMRTPPMEHDSRVRQAIDGIPCDMFAGTSENETPYYFGQFVLNNEKSKSGKIFGMEGNDAEMFDPSCPIALESLENKYAFTLFQAAGSADSAELEEQMMESFDNAFEFNYPEDTFYNEANAIASLGNDYDPNKNLASAAQRTAIKRLMGFIYDSVAASQVDMSEPEYGGHGEWTAADKQKWGSQYFKAHAAEYFDVNYLLTYYIITDYWASVDQRAKNILWRTWDGMKWFPTYYDGDTAMGVRNDAFLVYKYDITRDTWDTERGKYAFEGHDSWLWCLVLANYESELAILADSLRRGGYMSNTEMLNEFNEVMMGNWSERQYNKSGKLKYVDTMFKSKKYFPFTLQGNKELHRTQFITERSALLDARYNTENYRGDIMTLRINRAATDPADSIMIVSGDLYYYGWRENNTTKLQPVRVNNGETYQMMFEQAINSGSSYVAVMGASKIKELDLTGLGSHLVTELQLGNCSLLTKLVVKSDNGIAQNVNMTLGGLDTLEHVDLTGQTSLYMGNSGYLNMSGQSRLRILKLGSTNFTNVSLPEGAPVTELVLPSTLATLNLRYLPHLTMEGLSIQGYANIRGFNFSNCPNLDWKELLDNCTGVTRVRVEGVKGKISPEWLQDFKNRGVKGYDESGSPVEYPALVGTVTLTKVVDDEELAELRRYFHDEANNSLTITECQYSVYEFDDTQSDPACVTNLENGTSGYAVYDNETGELVTAGYTASGHALKVRQKMKPVFGRMMTVNGEKVWQGAPMSESNYANMADGTTVDNTGLADAMMLLPHCWYKGINDYKNQKKYICWSALDNEPQSSAAHTNRYTLSDEILYRAGGNISLENITEGESTLASEGVIAGSTGFNIYKINVEGMKQVRWPGRNSSVYGVAFLDANGVIIEKWGMSVSGDDFDFMETEGDYIFRGDFPDGAVEFVFSSMVENHGVNEVIAVDTDEVEAIEPDWVEHKECLVGIYQASVDTDGNLRSLSGKTVKLGTGTSTTWNGWNENNLGNPTVITYPSNIKFTMKDFQNVSRLRGLAGNMNGYQLIDYEMHKFVAILFYCLYGNLNAQEICGNGAYATTTGYTNGTNGSNITGNDNSYKGQYSGNKCLGIESFFGCVYEWVDNIGINVASYITFYRNKMSGGTANRRWVIYDPVTNTERSVLEKGGDGYIKRVRNGRFCDIVPTATGGTGAGSSYRYADYNFYSGSTGRVLGRSSSAGSAYGGLAYASAVNASSYSSAYCGSRLAFRGKIEIQELENE